MRIDKVNLNPNTGTTLIEFSTVENDGKDFIAHRLKSNDDPHPGLAKALRALKESVETLAELEADYLDDVRGVTIHRDEDDPEAWTCTFTATKKLSGCNSPLVVNTPSVAPSELERQMIQKVLSEAGAYLKGKRAQAELPLDKKQKQAGEREEREPEEPKPAARPEEVAKPKGKAKAEKAPEKPKGKGKADAYPKTPAGDDSGQVYKRLGNHGGACVVKQDGAGAWWGRVDGKPIAARMEDSAKARQTVDEWLKKEHGDKPEPWKPTIELSDVEAPVSPDDI